MENETLINVLRRHQPDLHPVLPFDPGRDKLYTMDFTERNQELVPEQIADTELFAQYINETMQHHGARYGIGGYNEHRTLYARSKHFDQGLSGGSEAPRSAIPESKDEPRRLHLGVDVWGPAGTKIMSPLDGILHSFAFNNNDSDYGATMIVTHILDGVSFHILYGHLSLNSLKNLREGLQIGRGDVIAETGMRFENGNWPPHLHIQLIQDMQGWKGDYPGVCKFSEREVWLANCPDAGLVLRMGQ